MNQRYLVKRTAQAVGTLFVVVSLTFTLIRLLPGSPEDFLRALQAQQQGVGSTQNLEETANVGQDLPIYVEYVNYVTNVFQGELGRSVAFDGRPVADILVSALPWTVLVVSVGLTLTFAIGVALGAVLAYNEGTRLDVVVSTLATWLNSVPYFVAGILMVYVLGAQLHLFPASGRAPQGVEPGLTLAFVGGVIYHAALPIASIVVTAFGFTALSMRGNSIQVLGEDYVRVADLRGLSDDRIALSYVGRNAILPLYTGFLIAIGAVLGSTVVLEQVFQYQGIGYYLFRALGARDYPLMMGAFIVITAVVIVGLFVADLTYGLIDPRASTTDNESSSGSRLPLRYRLGLFLSNVRDTLTSLVDDDDSPATRGDGGAVASATPAAGGDGTLFQETSDVTLTRKERFERFYREFVAAPAEILWEDKRARLGILIVGLYLFLGTVGVMLIPAPEPNQAPRLVGPSLAHPLGTDPLGQSLLSLVVHSTPPMLKMMFSGALFATGVGTLVGLVSGYSRGRVDSVLTQISDVVLTIPGLPLVMVLAVIVEPTNPFVLGVLLTINAWGGTARQIRSQVLSIGRQSYVEASGIMSLGMGTILLKDILPNIAPFVAVKAVQAARRVIFAAVALFYLGVLSFSDATNWGVTIRRAYDGGALYGFEYAHWLLAPMIAIVVLTYGLILFVQGTDKIFNPRVRARHIENDGDDDEDSGGNRTVAAMGGD